MTEAEANKLLAANDEETLIEKILTKYLAYCESRDFVLVSRPAIGGSAGRLPHRHGRHRRASRRRSHAGPGVLGPRPLRRRHRASSYQNI